MIKFSAWVIINFLLSISEIYASNITVCYYRSWAHKKLPPEKIDPNLCSVIDYSFYRINIKTLNIEGRHKYDDGLVKRLVALKKINPSLKVEISVGGWVHEDSPRFFTMVKSKHSRSIFINFVIKFLKKHNLDGINIDWEYPGLYTHKEPYKYPEERKKHKIRFVSLLQEMKKAFQKEAIKRNVERYLLTLAVPAKRKPINRGYNIPQISEIVDWINVMAYNLRGKCTKKTCCSTQLKGKAPNIPDSLDAWIDGGMDPSKINLGMVSYANSFKLKNRDVRNVGAPIIGKGATGPSTKVPGYLAYFEICTMPWKHKTSWKDSSCGVPYASDSNDDTWVSYDNPSSIRNKVSTIVNRRKLNGISLWALDFDDFDDDCREGKYPILKAAVDTMNGR